MLQYIKVTELGLQPTSLGKRSIIPPAGTSKIPCLVEKVEDPKTNDSDTKKNDSDTERTSVYSEHFKYIATMTSFRDTHFKKTIRKDLLSNPDESWKAFTSLSSAWVWTSVSTKTIRVTDSDFFDSETLLRKIGISSWNTSSSMSMKGTTRLKVKQLGI